MTALERRHSFDDRALSTRTRASSRSQLPRQDSRARRTHHDRTGPLCSPTPLASRKNSRFCSDVAHTSWVWTGELPRPGTFVTKSVAGHPVLVTRADDGVLRAFKNACTHRGAQVADGCGEARRLTCPYHAWSFALDGSLAGQPDSYAFDEIDRMTLGLEPLPIADVAGLIAVGPERQRRSGGGLCRHRTRAALVRVREP